MGSCLPNVVIREGLLEKSGILADNWKDELKAE